MAGPVPGTRVGVALKRPFDARARAALVAAPAVASPTGIAKQSTRFLAAGETAVTCNVDQSQYATNLSTNVTYCFEASTTRFNRGEPRTLGFKCRLTNAQTGTLFRHGSGANTEELAISAANTLRVIVNNAIVLTQTLSVLTGNADTIVIAYAQEANPDTTGAADAVTSHIMVWNVSQGTFERFRLNNATKTLQAGATAVWGADTHPAGTPFGGTILGWWFENRLQSATEIAADWVADVAAVTSSAHAVTDLQGIPPAQGVIDGESSWQGPAHVWVGDATRRMERRTLQWLVNDRLRIVPAWSDALLTATDAFIRGAPGDSDDRMSIAWLRVAPVPDNCNRIWARVHVRSYVTSGTAVPVRVRLYSFSKPPGSLGLGLGGNGEQVVSYYCGTTILRNDGAVGSYVVLGNCPIARGTSGIREGKTYLALALAVDPGNESGNDSAARIEIGAIHVVPYYREGGQGLPVHP